MPKDSANLAYLANLAAVAMNPVRQRIVQYLILHPTGTAGEIARELSDVPKPSLYRHIRILYEAGCLQVVGETAVRGATQKTYALVKEPLGAAPTNQEVALLLQNSLLSILSSFARYFSREDIDPKKDMISLTSSTLLLSDEEFLEMLGRIGAVYNDYIHNAPGEGRRPRTITIISEPPEDNDTKEDKHA